MKLLRTLLEMKSEETDPEELAKIKEYDAQVKKFTRHGKKIGLKVSTNEEFSTGHAFKMRTERAFDIYFYYTPAWGDKIQVQYVLGDGKHYNFNIPLARFLTFDKSEINDLHKELKTHQDRYESAVRVVKEMPKIVKEIIVKMVK